MNEYRWCEQCGAKMDYQIWFRANYCQLCGTPLRKEPYRWSNAQREQQESSKVGVIPASAVRHLQVAGMIVKDHPVACSLGAIGVGAAGIVVAPLAMAAGQGIMILGGIVAGVSGFANSNGHDFDNGVKLGLGMLAAGAVVYGSGFVLLGAGGVSIAAGVGGTAYAGVKAITKAVKSNRRIVGPLLLEEHEQ